ncbi:MULTISPECIES: hypothetical protein [unclassified Spiroplasma]|uniref:hypothetical protein n=1 Tax=unclassified Spiroplasma TaxID=2637901 RepID=UPI0030CF289F
MIDSNFWNLFLNLESKIIVVCPASWIQVMSWSLDCVQSAIDIFLGFQSLIVSLL